MSDSILRTDVASSNPKDLSKKKRANRSAKLKQSKLDVRREQWLSQVKKKGGCKEVTNGGRASLEGPLVHLQNTRDSPMEKFEVNSQNEENYEASMHHYSDSESLSSNSPTSQTSSVLGSNVSGVNFTASSSSSSSSGRSSSSSNGQSYSDDEDGRDAGGEDDDCLDDWEAMADALEEKADKRQDSSPKTGCGSTSPMKHETAMEVDDSSTGSESGGQKGLTVNCCAWRADDACRPQNLPNLSKQYSFPLNSDRHLGRNSIWAYKDVGPVPTSCPICFEDFDCTDSSFLPCSCGFRLCLFCHKRILEEDGRCPGCRKKYECEPVEGEATMDGGSLTFRLARSCSMITRS